MLREKKKAAFQPPKEKESDFRNQRPVNQGSRSRKRCLLQHQGVDIFSFPPLPHTALSPHHDPACPGKKISRLLDGEGESCDYCKGYECPGVQIEYKEYPFSLKFLLVLLCCLVAGFQTPSLPSFYFKRALPENWIFSGRNFAGSWQNSCQSKSDNETSPSFGEGLGR